MGIAEAAKTIMEQRGITQAWVVNQMNLIDPYIGMSPCKISAIVHGKRKMSGDELIAFCKATNTSPDIFFDLQAS